jgi:F-type H+-transporting ATPase subunit delta
MKAQIIVKRYARGLVDSIRDKREFSRIFKEVGYFNELLKSRKDMRDALLKPFIPHSKAKKIVEELLKSAKADRRTARFLLLLMEHERFALLDEILAVLPEVWNKKRGIVTLEVSTVIPLNKNQEKRLKEKLEKIEKNPVSLRYKIDKDIIGGLSVRRENTFIDISVRGDLMKLGEKIKEG